MKNKTFIASLVGAVLSFKQALALDSNINFDLSEAFRMFGLVFSQIYHAIERYPSVRFGLFFIFVWVLFYNILIPLINRIEHFQSSSKVIAGSLGGLATIAISYSATKVEGGIDKLFFGTLIGLLIILVLRLISWLNGLGLRGRGFIRNELRHERQNLGAMQNQEREQQRNDANVNRNANAELNDLAAEEGADRNEIRSTEDIERAVRMIQDLYRRERGND